MCEVWAQLSDRIKIQRRPWNPLDTDALAPPQNVILDCEIKVDIYIYDLSTIGRL